MKPLIYIYITQCDILLTKLLYLIASLFVSYCNGLPYYYCLVSFLKNIECLPGLYKQTKLKVSV